MAYFDKYGVEFSDDRKTLIKCPKDFQGVYVIPADVQTIGRGAFARCEDLISVKIPNSVTRIEWGAFIACKNLSYIIIPDSVSFLGHQAFEECENLRAIALPTKISHIGSSTFYRCHSLTSLVIPEGVTSIGILAFGGCRQMHSIILPRSIREIGNCAFGGCEKLSEIIVPVGFKNYFIGMDGLKHLQNVIHEENCIIIDLDEITCDMTRSAKYIFFDTETTGVPRNYKAPMQDTANWPRLVQLAWLLVDERGTELKRKSVIIRPDGFTIPEEATQVHGITTERAQNEGLPLRNVLDEFMQDLELAEEVVGHNIDFDIHIVGAELCRLGLSTQTISNKPTTCTMKSFTNFCAIPSNNGYGGYKWPTLEELYYKVFGCGIENAHDALGDVIATKECFFELKRIGIERGYGASGGRTQNNDSDVSNLPF